ncbi:MoxR family ATPase [Henriciella sp.]|jgi:MoxR-like ATPase|uniref:AAA family ATPase n=1 Tax=uncultured Henriciella sp. TaxID=1608424 RepID=UPI0025BC23D4|nr:MoxR family ATPase [Henriciella sp.]|tara:strand:+ start:3022 stop:3969 length:948 start_codon:yes stop_codon:yes gene_type:complete
MKMEDLEASDAPVDGLVSGLEGFGYVASRRIATALYLSLRLKKPILVEGAAGVGKTELALSTSQLLGLPLIRMQCYEGLDESRVLYEWKYAKQLLYTQLLKERVGDLLEGASTMDDAMARLRGIGDMFFSEDFLQPRPLLQSLMSDQGCVLLIDEVDKTDEAFEALLLETLSAYQVSLPEIGVIKASTPPIVFLTSNNIRELGDALKRRCIHLSIPLPSAELESRIVEKRLPDISSQLRGELVTFVQELRHMKLRKPPSISETVEWAQSLLMLHVEELGVDVVRETLNVLLKFESDVDAVEAQAGDLVRRAKATR